MRAGVVIEQCWHRVPGGTASAVIDQIAAVAATDRVDQVGVAARHNQPAPDAWRPPIPVRHLPLPRLALYWAWHLARRPAIERVTGPVDVIHATGYAIPPRTAPLVATLHDLAWRRDRRMFTRNGVRFFEAALSCVVDDADLVLCPSRATMEDCEAAGIEPARLRHVPWGMTTVDVTDDEIAHVRRRFGLTGRYVLSVGTLEPRKNLPRLLDAFGRLPQQDVTLVVVGPDGWGESLAAPAEALRDRLRLTGFVPRPLLAPLYAGAAVVCYPSLWEGYGLPVAEAMGAGAPVVTSAGTATEELVDGGAGLAVDPRDPDAIAGAIAKVLDDDDLADRLRAAGRARAAETTWAGTAEATIAAYEEVVGR
jgi:glycosyltransferase involved in cell wall biosynthesis